MRERLLFQKIRMYFVLVLGGITLFGCSMLNPFSSGPSLPKLPGTGNAAGATGGALAASGVTIDQIGNFAWLSVILVLFFPKMREPLVSLWTAIFGTLAIPFIAARHWADAKFASKAKKPARKTTRKR